jgi:hypothetical protein
MMMEFTDASYHISINQTISSIYLFARLDLLVDRHCHVDGVGDSNGDGNGREGGGGQKSLGSAGAEGLSIQTSNLHQDIQYALPKRTPARRFVGPCRKRYS